MWAALAGSSPQSARLPPSSSFKESFYFRGNITGPPLVPEAGSTRFLFPSLCVSSLQHIGSRAKPTRPHACRGSARRGSTPWPRPSRDPVRPPQLPMGRASSSPDFSRPGPEPPTRRASSRHTSPPPRPLAAQKARGALHDPTHRPPRGRREEHAAAPSSAPARPDLPERRDPTPDASLRLTAEADPPALAQRKITWLSQANSTSTPASGSWRSPSHALGQSRTRSASR